MARKAILAYIFYAIAVASIIGHVAALHSEGFTFMSRTDRRGTYSALYEEHFPRREIKEFAVADGKIYVHYEDVGLVNVYDIQGKFLYGIKYGSSANGVGIIAVDDGLLWVSSREHTIYLFDEDQLKGIYPYSYEFHHAVFSGDLNHEADGKSYYLSENRDVCYTDSSGNAVNVVRAPQENPFVEGSILIFNVSLILGVGFQGKLRSKKKQ